VTQAREIARLERLVATDWEALDGVTFLLPTGSTEQHGPHLPVGTDTAIALAVCEAACALGDDLVLAPAIPFGVSDHHKHLPGGAVSARPAGFAGYLQAVLLDLLGPRSDRGRAAVIVNGHGGNWPSITFALDELGAAHGELPLAACSWWDLVPELVDHVDPNVPALRPGHAGAVETSIMLALEPALVRTGTPAAPSQDVRSGAPRLHRWLDFSRHFETGVIGTPGLADPELGRRIVDQAAHRLVELAHGLRP
jgi:creatinine amidohydrolase